MTEAIFERNKQLLGDNLVDIIKTKNVLICGLGGVGGYALESLVRLGFYNLIIVDYDVIDDTNINRQIIATTKNIGAYKTDEFLKRCKEINPNVNITALKLKISEENIDELFKYKFDYVVDCIDDVNAKLLLYKLSIKNKIKIISSMGAANKIRPFDIKIDKLTNIKGDKLGKKVKELCDKNKINTDKIKVVYSEESKFNLTSKELPSIVLVPAAFGLYLAYSILNDIIKSS